MGVLPNNRFRMKAVCTESTQLVITYGGRDIRAVDMLVDECQC